MKTKKSKSLIVYFQIFTAVFVIIFSLLQIKRSHIVNPPVTGDLQAPANVKALTTLRNTSENYLDLLPAKPAWLKQVHGTKVVCAENLTQELPEADAAISFAANNICVVRTADCLPILVCDTKGTQVAAIHAGWRGLAAGIIAATNHLLTAPVAERLVWLGPAIGPQVFEVGQDVLDSFLGNGWESRHIQQAFMPKQEPQKFLGDLYYLARIALQQLGFLDKNIYGGEYCTYSDPARFYSYRRSADSGRMASLIWCE